MTPIQQFHRRLLRAVLLLSCVLALSPAVARTQQPLVQAVDSVGMTVSDMDRSVEFYSTVLSFEKVSDVEVWGTE